MVKHERAPRVRLARKGWKHGGQRPADHALDIWMPPLTHHARIRIGARRIPLPAVEATLAFGRKVHIRGACIHVIGRREVEQHRRVGIGLDACEGVQVVCGLDGAVLTAYRNRDFHGLRQQGRARGKRRATPLSWEKADGGVEQARACGDQLVTPNGETVATRIA